ncbi:MAG: hypothetical protein JWN34_3155 [Bryobacterales bacterium]|nr:hypothetical protein [Bryobacterales bacterium]
MKAITKRLAHAFAVALVFAPALTCGFARFLVPFSFWAQFLALIPGLPGDYLRVAYYCLTLRSCHRESRIGFGSYFSRPDATVAHMVYIGSYCVLGNVHIGERTQIASAVQILSGRHQHGRNADGRILGSDESAFTAVRIGADCWVGAQAIIMADVGARTTVGAGCVVIRPAPSDVVIVGNPGRVVSGLTAPVTDGD